MRSFEEQRFGPILSDITSKYVQGPKTRKKLWNAVNEGRKEASQSGPISMGDYASQWINTSIRHLAQDSFGHPASIIEAPDLTLLFDSLFQSNGLPLHITSMEGLPPAGWQLVGDAVVASYISAADGSLPPPP